jgi:hypothetical protein
MTTEDLKDILSVCHAVGNFFKGGAGGLKLAFNVLSLHHLQYFI